MPLNRRQFIGTTLATGLTATAPAVHGAAKAKANAGTTRYKTALIGCGWWGGTVLTEALDHGQSQMVALCDPDERLLGQTRRRVQKRTGEKPKTYTDFRKLLENHKPDIVINTTPDHWHALVTLAAIEAGAHVYLEKPIGHTINEGRAMVDAARAKDRVVQVDLHRRGSPHNQWAIKFLKQGRLGTVGMVRAFTHSPWGPGEAQENEPPPKELDWDLWCGPAPKRPFNPSIHPKGFRQWLDYANGNAADWGIHWLDHIPWWSGQSWARQVSSVGGKYIRKTRGDAPDTQTIHYAFDGFIAEWGHRMYAGNSVEQHELGLYFYGSEGILHIGWHSGARFYPTGESEAKIHKSAKLHKPEGQNIPELWTDFIDAIENDRRPMCDIEIGHYSTNLCLLGMLSYKLGRGIEWDGEQEQCLNDPEANALLSREYREPWQYPGTELSQ